MELAEARSVLARALEHPEWLFSQPDAAGRRSDAWGPSRRAKNDTVQPDEVSDWEARDGPLADRLHDRTTWYKIQHCCTFST